MLIKKISKILIIGVKSNKRLSSRLVSKQK